MNKELSSTQPKKNFNIVLILLIIGLIGIILRFAFVWQVGHHPSLNIYLAQSDLFNYDIMARDLLLDHPLGLRMIGYPFFIYYLKFFYQLFGTSPLFFYIHNYILSIISVFLLYRIGEMHWGRLAGLLAALMLIFYKMNYLYDALKIHTVLSQFLIIATLYFFCAYRKNDSIYSYIGFAVTGIMLSLIRVFFGITVVSGAVFLMITKQQWKNKAYGFLIAGLCILAVTGFNRLHSTDTYSHKFGVHFYIGNYAETTGLFTPIKGVRTHAQGFALDTILVAFKETGTTDNINTYWMNKTFDSYKNNPMAIFKVLGKKVNLFANNYEPHNNASVYFYEKKTFLKYFPRLDYAVIFAFAVVGIIRTFTNRLAGRYLFLPTVIICLMIFSVFFSSRYRLPIIPFFCLYAGCGSAQLIQFHKSRDYRKLIIYGVLAGLLLSWSYHQIPVFNKSQDVRFWETRDRARIVTDHKRRQALAEFRNWEKLEARQKISLTGQLGELGLIHDFFEVVNEAHQLAVNMNDQQNNVYLLSVKASIHEEAFQLREALKIWQELKMYKAIEKIAQQKINDLEVAGSVLDPDS